MQSSNSRLMAAISKWLLKLEQVPGWREWKREATVRAFWYDDEWLDSKKGAGRSFELPEEIDREHAVITGYLTLHSVLESLRDCQYYFRRYPFRGTPVRKHDHLRYICEMYFGRFYEFEEKLGICLNAVNKTSSSKQKLDVGGFIKVFKKEFKAELLERHNVNHRGSFSDIAIDNLLMLSLGPADTQRSIILKQRGDAAYRRACKEWAERVVARSKRIEVYLDAVASSILQVCPFVSCFVETATPLSDDVKRSEDATEL